MPKKRGFSYALLGSVRNPVPIPLPLYVHALGHTARYFPYVEDLPPREEPFVELYWCIAGAGNSIWKGKSRRSCVPATSSTGWKGSVTITRSSRSRGNTAG